MASFFFLRHLGIILFRIRGLGFSLSASLSPFFHLYVLYGSAYHRTGLGFIANNSQGEQAKRRSFVKKRLKRALFCCGCKKRDVSSRLNSLQYIQQSFHCTICGKQALSATANLLFICATLEICVPPSLWRLLLLLLLYDYCLRCKCIATDPGLVPASIRGRRRLIEAFHLITLQDVTASLSLLNFVLYYCSSTDRSMEWTDGRCSAAKFLLSFLAGINLKARLSPSDPFPIPRGIKRDFLSYTNQPSLTYCAVLATTTTTYSYPHEL